MNTFRTVLFQAATFYGEPLMDKNQKKWLWISVGFSTIVLVLVLYFTVDATTFEYLKQLNVYFLLLALCNSHSGACILGTSHKVHEFVTRVPGGFFL